MLRATLHHGPTLGGPQEALRHAQQYADPLAVYEHWFGAPPADLWPGTRERFAAGRRMRRVDLGRPFVLPRPRWPRRIAGSPGLLALAASLVTGDALALGSNPLDWTGGPFLQLYLLLMLVAVIGSIVLRRSLRDTGAGSGGTPDVFELRDAFDLPGMKILQFAFSGPDNVFLPQHFIPNCVAYTVVHDNDTTLGWYLQAPASEQDFAKLYLHVE